MSARLQTSDRERGRGMGYWLNEAALVREDGVILRREHVLPEGGIRFRYIDKDVTLAVPAQRKNDDQRATELWEVDLACALRSLTPRERSHMTFKKLQEIAGNIKDALLAWPPEAMGTQTPAHDVTFC